MKKFNTAGMLAVLMLCLTACGSGTDAGETRHEFPDTCKKWQRGEYHCRKL